ncbi:MAG TPA: C-terminal binding protein [Pirellulales bacterium]|jgi:D-3-phosphoglycerate dehydrogenase|nr:C-terminal binding protein [Pirellulales bacterium]
MRPESPRPKVLLTDYAWPELSIERSVLEAAGTELVVADRTDEASLAELAARESVAGIMTTWARVTASVIGASPQLRIVARLGIGLDNIDVATATRLGVLVTNVPDYCLIEVAEHTLALMLALARKVGHYHWQTKTGIYALPVSPPLRRVQGQTLGLIGLGNIGRVVAAKAQALGLRVIAHTRTPAAEVGGVPWRPLDNLLVESDFVSLHVPSTPATRQMIGTRELALMKPTAYLINTARGALVDHHALAAALAAGRLAGAGLDVQEPEPPDLATPPWNDPRVIVTPHAAFVSAESLADLRRRAASQVADCLAGRTPPNVVNALRQN